MNLIICVDENLGMSFNGRRVSRDSVVVNKIIQISKERKLWIHSTSASLFSEDIQVEIDDNLLHKAGSNDLCFVENLDVSDFADSLRSVTIFNWNRRYPSDVKFPVSLFADRWKLVHREEFKGYSHEKITMKVYEI